MIQLHATLYENAVFLSRSLEHRLRVKRRTVHKPFKMPYLWELRAVLITFIRQGILYPSRRKFWKSLFRLMRQRPEGLVKFLVYCMKAEHYLEFRQTIASKLRPQMDLVKNGAPTTGDRGGEVCLDRFTGP